MKSTDQRRNTTTSKTDTNRSSGNTSCPTVEGICHSSVHPIKKSTNVASGVSRTFLTHLLLLWIAFTFCFIGGYSAGQTTKSTDIYVQPLNLAVAKGAKGRLNCSTGEGNFVEWRYVAPQDEDKPYAVIHLGPHQIKPEFKSRFFVDNSTTGHFDLLFNAVENTSGTFYCRHDDTTMIHNSAEVIVLDAQPTCSKEVISDFIKASCSIRYTGYWAPKLEWRNMSGIVENNDTFVDPNKRVVSHLIVSFNQTAPGASFTLTCTPVFMKQDRRNKKRPQKEQFSIIPATNDPVYTTSCTLTIGASDKETAKLSASFLLPPPLYIIGLVFVFAYVFPLWLPRAAIQASCASDETT